MCFGGGGGVAGDEVAAEFFFSLLSYSLLLPLVSRRGGGGENPLDKEDYEDCDWLHATLFRETVSRRGARARR